MMCPSLRVSNIHAGELRRGAIDGAGGQVSGTARVQSRTHEAHYLDGQDRVTPNGLVNLRFEAEGPNSYVIVIGPNKSERFDARPEELAS